jgi:DNA-binding response OmpR family regulator
VAPTPTILIVEDNPPTRDLYRRVLAHDYRLLLCADAAAARRALGVEPVALVLLEPSMPGDEGWSLLDMIRGGRETRHIPVVLCSAVDERARGATLAAAFLLKPVPPSALLATIRQLLRLPAALPGPA